ncbi:GNAT family N-acetyltransferase [Sphingomicrobium flavum]|uniref:GNAT family N-acetyltransferase n=1 Tax=Sphingomicrobium flavum TaxID=1229164 RepID=UPI0021AD91B7|nr:GNAT family N-acetyltransferase [Sphingomicrobium flavum]
MAPHEPDPIARLHPAIAAVDAADWDGLAGASDPFLSHAFLSLLESSGSVGEGSGWSPLHVAVEQDGRLIAAAPAYLKAHSQGEYVFDHGWADAWHRAGGDYYPKLQVTVPFTPCPGPRLLGEDRSALIAALEAVTVQNQLSSAHATFCADEDIAAFEARGWLIRHGLQFHWHNRGYASFDDFLTALSSRKRKTMRRERAQAIEGLEIETLRGAQIGDEAVEAMWTFYQDTGSRKWGHPYLTHDFFTAMVEALGDHLLMFLARRNGKLIAGALNLIGKETLYGRYWGCVEEVPFLHFELSYYRAIDWAIAHGLKTVQAGAQGDHKLARGYEPVITRSAHFLPHPQFREAVAQFVEGEKAAMEQELAWARAQLPFRQSEG